MTPTPRIGAMFAADISGHQLTILLDQGDHKHLRAHAVDQETGRPRHLYSVDLILWPGGATVSGDMDGFTFKGAPDMLPLLRTATQNGDISWHYLAEKVAAGRDNVRGFSEEVFRREIRDQVAQDIRDRTAPKGIGRAVRDRVFGAWEYNLEIEADARQALKNFDHEGYEFHDLAHDDFDAFTSDFERAALGLQLVIRLYDRELAARAARQADQIDVVGGVADALGDFLAFRLQDVGHDHPRALEERRPASRGVA